MADTDNNSASLIPTDSIIGKAIDQTPNWVLGLAGGMITMSVCIIIVLQFSGLSDPLQRVINAQASRIERSAENIEAEMADLSALVQQVKAGAAENKVQQAQLDDHEERLDQVEDQLGAHIAKAP
jgi:cell shape-determining protein MreC